MPTQSPASYASAAVAPAVAARKKGLSPRALSMIVVSALFVGQILVWLACRVGERGAYVLGLFVTRAVGPLTRRRRDANIQAFFRQKNGGEKALADLDAAHLRYLARMRAEIARTPVGNPQTLKESVVLEGEQHLKAALARGRGALVVTGHTATWWFLPAALVARGYKVTAVFTPIKFPKVERTLLEWSSRYGVKIAFVGRDAYKAARQAIERNEILYLTFDVAVRAHRAQYFPFGDAWLQVDPGPAIMAVRNSMPTVQAACTHIGNGLNHASIYEPTPGELAPETMVSSELCRLWMERLEKEVHAHPEQWWPWGYVDLLDQRAVSALPAAQPSDPLCLTKHAAA